jgi:hypothetical protein
VDASPHRRRSPSAPQRGEGAHDSVGVSWSTVNPFGGRPMVQFVGWPGELGGDGSDVGSIRPGRVRAQPSARLNAR